MVGPSFAQTFGWGLAVCWHDHIVLKNQQSKIGHSFPTAVSFPSDFPIIRVPVPGGVRAVRDPFAATGRLSWAYMQFWFSRIYLCGLLPFMYKINLLLAVLIQEWFTEKFLLPMYSLPQTSDMKFQDWQKTHHDIDEKLVNECCQS